MFLGPYYPPLEPQDWKPNQGDLYKQYINDVGGFRAWIFESDQWQEYADMSDITFDLGWPDLPAEDPDVYWSGSTKWLMQSGSWVLQTQVLRPITDLPPVMPSPEAPEFPDSPADGDTWTDPITGDVWYWWDDRWQTKPAPGQGGGPPSDVYTYDVNVDESEKAAIVSTLRVIPDLDVAELNTQKDLNWAISRSIDALDMQVDNNTLKIADLTTGVLAGMTYDLVRASNYLRPPGLGELYVGNGFDFVNRYKEVRQVIVSHTDRSGTLHNIDNVEIGDTWYMESDQHNFGRYQVTAVAHTPGESSIITLSEPVSSRGQIDVADYLLCLAFPDVNVNDKATYAYVDALAQRAQNLANDLQRQIDNLSNS